VWDSVGVWPLGLCAQPAPPYPVPKASEPQPRALDTLPTGGCSAAPPLLRGSGAVMEATREGLRGGGECHRGAGCFALEFPIISSRGEYVYRSIVDDRKSSNPRTPRPRHRVILI
jgi:hypothetical protein